MPNSSASSGASSPTSPEGGPHPVSEGASASSPTTLEGASHQVSEGARTSPAEDGINLDDFDGPETADASETSHRYPTRSTRAVNPIYTLIPLGFSALSSLQPPSSYAGSLKGPTSFHPQASSKSTQRTTCGEFFTWCLLG